MTRGGGPSGGAADLSNADASGSRAPASVAVVVPCKDEARTISQCLLALRAQQPAPARIIVVDNGSRDGSLERARSLADIVLEIEAGTIGGLRNAGAREAPDADVLAFVDADVVVAPGWLAEAIEGLRTAALVGSRMDAPGDGTWVQKRWAALEGGGAGRQTSVWSGHMAITAEVFGRLGGFDATLATGEDSDLSDRVRAFGGSVRQLPRMRAIHHGFPPTLAAMWRRERWHSRTPGFLDRLSPRSRTVVLGATVWAAAGVLAAGSSLLAGTPVPATSWAALSAVGVAALGAASSRSLRHAVPDGVLIATWATARALRLPREVAHRRRVGRGVAAARLQEQAAPGVASRIGAGEGR